MRLHTEATDRRSVRLPSTTVALASRPSRRQRRAGQPRPATPQGRLCDDCSHQSHRRPEQGRRSAQPALATPPFGLTLRAMNVGMRHRRAPQWARFSLLMSVIALALACFPVLAQAECTSSSCVQYTESIPSAEGGNPSSQHHQQTPAKVSKTGGNGGSEPSSPSQGSKTPKEEGSEGGSSERGGVAAGGDGNGQGKPGGSANHANAGAVHPNPQQSGVKTAKSSVGGGSSPLVPILIAIAVFAAISVAAVMIRQRRQRRGPSAAASPEAS